MLFHIFACQLPAFVRPEPISRFVPSEEWKNGVGSALTAYAAGTGSWDDVVTAFVDGWAKEYKLANG